MFQGLKEYRVKTVAMECTGVYWIPLFEELERQGFECPLISSHWEWLGNDDISQFIREIKNEIGFWEEAQRSFQVCMVERLTEKDQIRADELVARRPIGASGIYKKKQDEDPIGARVTHNGAVDTISNSVGVDHTRRPARFNDPIGASGTV